MPIARFRLLGAALAGFTGPRRPTLVLTLILAVGLLIPIACSNEQPTEPGADKPAAQFAEASAGGFIRDDFTDANGTLLQNHTPDGGGEPFSWLLPSVWGVDAFIRDNAVGAIGLDSWAYVTSEQTGDWAELTVDVFQDVNATGTKQDIVIFLRTMEADNNDGYAVFWSVSPGVNSVSIDRPDGTPVPRVDLPAPVSQGLHTFRAEITASNQIEVRIDSVLVFTTTLGTSSVPGRRTGIGFFLDGTPSVRITSFSAAFNSVVVTLQRDDVPLSPSELESSGGLLDFNGQPIQTQMQLQVSVDSSGVQLPNRSVTLSATAIDSAGAGIDGPYGHFHTGSGGAQKPAGSISPSVVSTGSSRTATVTYKTGPISGPVVLRAESEGAKPTVDTIQVGVLGLAPLTGRNSYVLIGDKPWHPQNHWAVPVMVAKLNSLADGFYTTFNRPLYYNDISLPLGGRFDVDQNWACCHDEHRAGRDLDLRTDGDTLQGGLTPGQRIFVWDEWELLGGEVHNERVKKDKVTPNLKNPHYHFRYRRPQ